MAWYRAGGGGIPSSLKTDMNDVLNKKFGTSVDYPPTDWAPAVNLMGPLPEKTVSGAIVTFSDGADAVPIKSWEVTLPASLDGYSEVDVVHCGKNLADFSSNTQDGEYHATVSYQNNGASVSASGTYSRCAWIIPTIIGQTYTVSYSGIRDNEYGRVMFNDSNTASGVMAYGVLLLTSTEANYTKTFTATSDYLYLIIYNTGNTSTGTSTISNLMMEAGSTASTFEPFSGTTHTASLGRTIYGGQADIVNGTGTDGCSSPIALNSLTWSKTTVSGHGAFYAALPNGYIGEGVNPLDGVCSSYIVVPNDSSLATDQTCRFYYNSNFNFSRIIIRDDQYASYTGAQFKEVVAGDIVYQLAESAQTAFTFDPVSIDSKLGNNTIWSEQGSDTEVTYRADINLALGGQ